MNPSLPRPNIIHQHHLLHQHHHHDEHDSSSVGSGGNDSLGSGHHSPSSEMTRSESALELRGPRKNTLPTLSASQVQKSVFRKSMPMHLEDSDGNNADDDSVNSFISSSIHTNMDEIPTRDIGPERPSFTFSQVSFFQRFWKSHKKFHWQYCEMRLFEWFLNTVTFFSVLHDLFWRFFFSIFILSLSSHS